MYDFHIGPNIDEATKNPPQLSIEHEVHKRLKEQFMSYSFLSRMSDHFSDCTFTPDELDGLLSNLETLLSEMLGNSDSEYIEKLITLVKKALNNSYFLFGFCD